jgi:hypothetical protein
MPNKNGIKRVKSQKRYPINSKINFAEIEDSFGMKN